ncbi:MAG: fimbrillin family protein [Bacteroidaceae bacterium]|nr:fimbrillin family protein [Bacteroidaceae bacterium]
MKKTILLSLLAAAFLTACSSDDPEPQAPKQEEQPSQQEPRLLTVEVSETPLADANGTPNQIKTRTAEATTTASLKEFYLDFKNSSNEEPYKFEKDDKNVWNSISWPTKTSTGATIYNSDKLDFYAYNDGTLNWTSTNPYSDPYVSFTVDPHPTSHLDLLVATNTVSYNDHNGKVPLTFDHACAAVKFNVIKTSGAGSHTIVIKSVTLSGVQNQGQYHYDSTPKWKSLSGSADYTLTDGDITLSDNDTHPLPCGYLFLIPQTKSGKTLTVNYTLDNTAKTRDFSLTGTWEAGLEYTINIYIGESFIK